MIALIDVGKRGEVMQRLRGHEDEIHSLAWSPLDREGSLSSRSEDGEGLQSCVGNSFPFCLEAVAFLPNIPQCGDRLRVFLQ